MQAPGQVQGGSGEGPKVPEKVWEALVQSQVRFNRVPEKVPEKVWEALVQSQVRFNRVAKKVPEEGLGGFGAEPGQVQRGSGEEALVQSQVGFNKFPEKVPEKVWEALVQSRFRRGSGRLGRSWTWFREALVQSQGSGEGSGEGVGGFGAEPG